MGYACPVCEAPQRDAEHLANHLAFSAMLHGDDHETWLDEHVPAWNEEGPTELAAAVADEARETSYDEAFEDAVADQGHGPGRDHGHDHGRSLPSGGAVGGRGELDAEARQTLAEAREMTRAMLGETETDDVTGTRDRKDADGSDAEGDGVGAATVDDDAAEDGDGSVATVDDDDGEDGDGSVATVGDDAAEDGDGSVATVGDDDGEGRTAGDDEKA